MSTLDELIAQEVTKAVEQYQQKEQAEAALKQKKEQEARANIESMLRHDLTSEIYDSLVVMVINPTTAQFVRDGVTWRIERYEPRPRDWKFLPISGVAYPSVTCSHDELKGKLMLNLGLYQQAAAEWNTKQEQKRIHDEQAEQRLQAQRARERAEWEVKLAALQAVDAAIREEIARAVVEAKKGLWQWPHGAVLTYYHLTWTTGMSSEGEAATDSGYTLADALVDGWIDVTDWGGDLRRLRLDMLAHKPIWEQRTAESVDDLPKSLTQQQYIPLRNVEYHYLDGHWYWERVKGNEFSYELEGVVLPVEWLRSAIDALAS